MPSTYRLDRPTVCSLITDVRALIDQAMTGYAPRGLTRRVKSECSDLVTDLDRVIETGVRELLKDRFPGCAVWGEESGWESADTPRDCDGLWVVDPIDGTYNLTSGLPLSTFSLAFLQGWKTEFGLIVSLADPHRFWWALREHGSYAMENPISRPRDRDYSKTKTLVTELLNHRWWPQLTALAPWLTQACWTTRIFGSAAFDLTQVALGHATLALLADPHLLDLAAGVLLVNEAKMTAQILDWPASGMPPVLLAGYEPQLSPVVTAIARLTTGTMVWRSVDDEWHRQIVACRGIS
jgi:myo-inositol-1(or 4)-monophosphatase